MKTSRRSWWLIFAACAVLALGGLSWITATVLELERSERAAREETRHQETLRLALWRMDSWFGPLLAREAARPYFEYQPFYPEERAYNRVLCEIEPGEVLRPSPLLTQCSPFLRLHFQVDEAGAWSSPQVPTGNQLDLAQGTLVPAADIAVAAAVLEELAQAVSTEELRGHLHRAEAALPALAAVPARTPLEVNAAQSQSDAGWNGLLNRQEYSQRAASNVARQQELNFNNDFPFSTVLAGDGPTAGPFVPRWLPPEPGSEEPRLLFTRRIDLAGGELMQGFLGNWEGLRAELLGLVADLVPGARLVPHVGEGGGVDGDGMQLASIPVTLGADFTGTGEGPLSTPARATLAVSWLAAVLALGAVGITLRASITYGEKRSRFASAVTHELRTPLTTFRMYSEMLAKGMVPEERRMEYLETLRSESDRLSALVENVLAYARLEERTAPSRRAPHDAEDLVRRVLPELARRAAGAGVELRVLEDEPASSPEVFTDAEAVGQILFNLIDNACKYGTSGPGGGAIDMSLRAVPTGVEVRVRDHGPGVPSAVARAIFHPFERGTLDPADPHPGIGLGLALARGLARDLGGDLTLEAPADGGACFCLRLPSAP